MSRISRMTDVERHLRLLPRTFYALPLHDLPSHNVKQFIVQKVKLVTIRRRRLDEVYIQLPDKTWSVPVPFISNFKPLLNYKKPLPPKKKKWKLEIYAKNPRLVKRKNTSYGGQE